MDDNFINQVLALYKLNDWRAILDLNVNSDVESARRLLWVWPSVENLQFIQHYVGKFNVDGVVSLGCGCGLFEWFLKQFLDVTVLGVEVNREWWESKYSDPLFIPHIYPEFPIGAHFFKTNFALLFCYFNNRTAFLDYVQHYQGNLIFIIGPGEGRYTHTDPEPFHPAFEQPLWKLLDFQEVKDTKDFIAVYTRISMMDQ